MSVEANTSVEATPSGKRVLAVAPRDDSAFRPAAPAALATGLFAGSGAGRVRRVDSGFALARSAAARPRLRRCVRAWQVSRSPVAMASHPWPRAPRSRRASPCCWLAVPRADRTCLQRACKHVSAMHVTLHVSGQGAPAPEAGSERSGSSLPGKLAALEDEVDFLSLKLKEEESARKAAEREAHRCTRHTRTALLWHSLGWPAPLRRGSQRADRAFVQCMPACAVERVKRPQTLAVYARSWISTESESRRRPRRRMWCREVQTVVEQMSKP
jgi:hypothetical protein